MASYAQVGHFAINMDNVNVIYFGETTMHGPDGEEDVVPEVSFQMVGDDEPGGGFGLVGDDARAFLRYWHTLSPIQGQPQVIRLKGGSRSHSTS